MNWEQKLEALRATGARIKLEMRYPGNWYVSSGMDVAQDGFLVGKHGNGTTPQEAVEDHWKIYSSAEEVCVSSVDGPSRRVRWNGYMWEEIKR